MKAKSFLFIGITMLLATTGVYAQDNVDRLKEVYVNEHIPNKKLVPYPYTREADVMWSKTIWRIVDLREKQNLPLYFPTRPIGDRMSLIDLLLEGIDKYNLTAYDPDIDTKNEFKQVITKEKLERLMGAGEKRIKATNEQGESKDTVVQFKRRKDDVKQLLIKERWFFDRNYSTLQVRIIGLCPIRITYREDQNGNPTDELVKTQTFWIYFPEVRPLFANHMVYNTNNDSQPISFDDFFLQRRFGSRIIAESNVYDNRQIQEYTQNVHQLYESERIKNSIFEYEQDLWEY
jgi:gliding motility associated protien GldN